MCTPRPVDGHGHKTGWKGLSAAEGRLRQPGCRPNGLVRRLCGEGGPLPEVTGVVLPLREHLTRSEDLSGCHRFQGGGGEGSSATGV